MDIKETINMKNWNGHMEMPTKQRNWKQNNFHVLLART